MQERSDGDVQPGIRWGIFTLRIPFIHIKPSWPEFFQGCFVTTAIGFSLAPILVNYFGLTFNEALAMCFIQATLIYLSPMVFGEPFIAGWITPAFPLVLAFITGSQYETPELRFQALAAMSILFSVLTIFLGATGLGLRFIALIPRSVKAGVLLAAALSALKRIFVTDIDSFLAQPYSLSVAIIVVSVMTFSLPFQQIKSSHALIANISRFGYLPGLFLAGVVGVLVGELSFSIEWGFISLPFVDLWQKVSPLCIGWPSWDMYVAGFPLVVIGYIAVFGDVITGNELVEDSLVHRNDEKIDINSNRTHLALGIRNALMAILAPFFTTQGHLWSGTQVLILQRWREGRESMDSIFSGIASFSLEFSQKR